MNWTLFFDIATIVVVILGFAGTVWYLMTHNPNYAPIEILRNPWKLFDLIDHAKEHLGNNLTKIKEETKQAMDAAKEIKDDVKEIVRQVQETVEEVKKDIEEIKEIKVKVIDDKEIVDKD